MMKQQTAVITGASHGIGLAIARELSRRGWCVYGLCRHPGEDPPIHWLPCDITDPASVEAAFQTIAARTPVLDVLINNAGMGISGAAEFAEDADVRHQLDVNYIGAWRCTRAALPLLRRGGRGRIFFVSSLGALFPLPFQSFYSASKAAILTLSDCLRLELAPFGLESCALLLNDVKTDFTASRQKNHIGNDLYAGRIDASVAKMEASEQAGLTPEAVADSLFRLLQRRRLPPHAVPGFSNKLLVLLGRLLPTRTMLWMLGKIYG